MKTLGDTQKLLLRDNIIVSETSKAIITHRSTDDQLSQICHRYVEFWLSNYGTICLSLRIISYIHKIDYLQLILYNNILLKHGVSVYLRTVLFYFEFYFNFNY